MSSSRANPDTAHIPIHYDPGHIKKNFQKSLMAIYGAGVRYKGLAERGGQSDNAHIHSTDLCTIQVLSEMTVKVSSKYYASTTLALCIALSD